MTSYSVTLVSLGLSASVVYRLCKTLKRRITSSIKPYTRHVYLTPVTRPLVPSTTILTFDIHGVLFTKDYKKIAGLLWQNPHALKILIYALNPLFIYDVIKLVLKKGVTEEYIIGLGKKHASFAQFVPLGIQIANAQKPITSTVHIAHALKKKGYEIHILSNIGTTIYADLEKQYPDVFAPFTVIFAPCAENNYCGKPHQAFFDAYAQQYAKHKQLILIDDKPINIKKAAHAGMGGICFTHPKTLLHILHVLAML